MVYATQHTTNRIHLTRADAVLVIEALNLVHDTIWKFSIGRPTVEVDELLDRFKHFVEISDWSPTEK